MDHGDDLSKFFGLIKNFNMGLDLKQSLKIEIEEFFDYKVSLADCLTISAAIISTMISATVFAYLNIRIK